MADRIIGRIAGSGAALMAVVLLGMFAAKTADSSTAGSEIVPFELPEFPRDSVDAWLNSPPLGKSDLAGKVVLVDFWTFDCWNCYRSFPWLNGLEKRFAERDLVVIGIHTPEFAHEKERDRVMRKIEEFGLHHPVMMDNDFGYWRAMGNFAWPSYYLVDRGGKVRYRFVGETHEGDTRARAIESAVESLLAGSARVP